MRARSWGILDPVPAGPPDRKAAMPSSNLFASIRGWLRAGYPEGVPPKDFYPLLALMARTLSEDELDRIVETVIAENPEGGIRERDVRQAIEHVKQDPPNQADVRDVAARLAAAGWPLGDPDAPRLGERSPAAAGGFGRPADPGAGADTDDGERAGDGGSVPGGAASPEAAGFSSPGAVQRVIDWFDFGYPDGVPATERVPILALLRPRLTDAEAERIAHRLAHEAEGETVRTADAHALITDVTRQTPTPHELDRVAARLAARGWPLAADIADDGEHAGGSRENEPDESAARGL